MKLTAVQVLQLYVTPAGGENGDRHGRSFFVTFVAAFYSSFRRVRRFLTSASWSPSSPRRLRRLRRLRLRTSSSSSLRRALVFWSRCGSLCSAYSGPLYVLRDARACPVRVRPIVFVVYFDIFPLVCEISPCELLPRESCPGRLMAQCQSLFRDAGAFPVRSLAKCMCCAIQELA